MKITREIKTALLVIASILLFVWGYSFLKGKDLLMNYKTFYVEYENVEGLATSAPVTINGLVIGRITSILLQNTTGKLIVELQIKNDFPITKSSMANIYEPGLIGGKQIQIVPNLLDNVLAQSGDTLKGTVISGLTSLVGEKLSPLQEKIERTFVSADSLLTSMNQVLDPKTRENLKGSIANLNETLAEFNQASKSVNSMLADNKGKINGIVTNFNTTASNFSKFSDTLAKADIGKSIRSLENTLAKVNNMMAEMESGKGTLGKLLKDDTMYKNLAGASKELELLLADFKKNPKRYVHFSVFGKKETPYVEPKKETIKESEKDSIINPSNL